MHQSVTFFGSDQYSAIVLASLLENRNTGILEKLTVITDRPKPKDRTQSIEPNPVEKLAINHNIKVSYYPSNSDEMINLIELLKSKPKVLGLCASFDHLLPAELIEIFGGHLYNLHPSLLPQYRNVSPVQYAVALGDRETGITLFRISTGIDNGEIISQVSEPISDEDTTPTLTSRLFAKGAELFTQSLNNGFTAIQADGFTKSPELIFTHRLTRQSGFIEWDVLHKLLSNQPVDPTETANELLQLRLTHNQQGNILHDIIRSLFPWPTVWSLVPTKKGELRVTLESTLPEITLKIAGKPRPITWSDFQKYYF